MAPLNSLALAPPLTRGWTLRVCGRQYGGLGSPAHAGMDLYYRAVRMLGNGLPRSRGDGPELGPKLEKAYRAPPLTRGWTPASPTRVRFFTGSPAHAGMDL